jgi:hypothetical protein
MLVYRIEDSCSGFGPYQYDVLDSIACERRPLPQEDGISYTLWQDVGPKAQIRFACATLDELWSWMWPEITEPRMQDRFVLLVYDVEPCAVWRGRHQVAFDLTRANTVKKRSLRAVCRYWRWRETRNNPRQMMLNFQAQ